MHRLILEADPVIIAAIILSFVIGSIPTGLLIAKSKAIDLRKVGSGNIGATNVMRAMGKEAAFLTLLGDIAKGAAAVGIAKALALGTFYEGALGLSSILGHNFSIFLKGKGGKGVATSLGVIIVFSPHVALFTAILWLLTAKWTRYSSLSALVAFGLLPLSIYMLDYSREKMIIAVAITVLIFIGHTANIKRLIQGTESKIGKGVK
ncbi:MAG: glycerol-3-phosphate 1-O-acyltransferase PlsY [Nitrospirae bacterium]|nr:glycerol-3-phosphate 1-O-acyltransferase PlsY [Nitrospirota bacterium]